MEVAMAGRRGHGEGSVFRRDADGKWLAVLEVGRDPRTGRRIRRTVTATTRREAVERLRQLRRAAEQGAVDADPRTTVAQWTGRWLEHVAYRRDVIGDLRPNTAGSYERLARIHVVAQLGAKRLTKLTPGDVERACQRLLDEGLSPSSVAKVVQVLRMMLDHAVREGAIVANPVARAQVLRQTREPATELAIHDVERILSATAGTTDAALWAMLALAGLRLGEGLGLAEHDVDLHARTVRIRRTLLRDRTFGPPKSIRGEREVAMPDRLVELLRRHRALIAEQRLAASDWIDTDALFPTRRGTYPLIRNVQRRFRRLAERLALPDGTSPHTLRHTWASTLLTSGVPIFLVSRYAGHATIQTTVDQYGHLLPGAQLIRDMLDARFRGSG
jgi:integrase